ncbi:lipid II:glycine glycyltransferase FemX [Halorussus halophilus]|uniref:lipid II:glycine glycyltransferase FemX n=1 Tax=Halorussus halophilus TaxID=2650975 RepID=UPI00130157D6|nr:GNAT family N-acetyltransferase [Halorussus halophilus]
MSVEITTKGILVREADDADRERWNQYVERSTTSTPFHRLECLRLLEEWSTMTLHLLVGYKGDQPIGLFPVFETSRGPLTLVFSPPPSFRVRYLGPILLDTDRLSQQRLEKRQLRFVDAVSEWIETTCQPSYVRIRTTDRNSDPRPFAWNNFGVTPRCSYVVDLTPDENELLDSFSSDARNHIRTSDESDYSIREGSRDDVRRLMKLTEERHAEKGVQFPLEIEFVVALYDALPAGYIRPYVCLVGGEPVGGTLTIEDGDTCYAWQGGVKPRTTILPVNDLVDWHIMREMKARGLTRYDFMGANERGLVDYKAKFAPELTTYYHCTRTTPTAGAVEKIYRQVKEYSSLSLVRSRRNVRATDFASYVASKLR